MAKKALEKEAINLEEVIEEQQVVESQSLTKENVEERLELIRKIVKEEHPVIASEKAHIEQDKLLEDVLVAIGKGTAESAVLAGAALKVFNLEFRRSYS